MTIEQAIKKAIEGGWKPNRPYLQERAPDIRVSDVRAMMHDSEVFLDPAFWQSLGKAMGWKVCSEKNTGKKHTRSCNEWAFQWHRFIDFLAEGRTAEDFFSTLSV